jgi:hypothetical protein
MFFEDLTEDSRMRDSSVSCCRFVLIAATLLMSARQIPQALGGLTIAFTGSTGNTNADQGFQLAADFLQSQFSDNVTVTIQRGFANLGAGILGQAGSTRVGVSYSSFRTAISSDQTSTSDAAFASSLPSTSFAVYTNRTSNNGNIATPYLDTAGTNTTNLQLTTANARALGLFSSAATDATITFSSNFVWDFDNRNGITAGSQDFVGVATHELMHALGFVSGVDSLDGAPGNLDDNYRVNPLDFARHSANSVAAGADVDFTADTRAKFFSIDGGTTNLTPGAAGGFSLGVNFGDGSQASHWKDNQGWGIMDPTANPAGSANVVTVLDLQALDIIGWNLTAVPEPSSLAMMAIAIAFAVCRALRLVPKHKLGNAVL